MARWSSITQEQRRDIVGRRYFKDVSIAVLAKELEMNVLTLNRRLQELRSEYESSGEWEVLAEEYQNKPEKVLPAVSVPSEKPLPTNEELFDILRKAPVSLGELSRRFDRSEATIDGLIRRMESAGYVIERSHRRVYVNTAKTPRVDFAPADTLADQEGQEFSFAVASDLHSGSTHSQPSAYYKFINIAYNEYGVRHVFDPGDKTTGVGGYRGQNIDLIEPIRPGGSKDYAKTTQAQIWLADAYTPRLPGLKYYVLGGNHDYWHIVNTGVDPIAQYCRLRDDSYYLGYDVADIPITDRVAARLWHPTGGVPYSLSYRVQKGLEQLAFDELTRAVETNENPKVRFLLAGHLHVEVKFHRGPMVAAHVGCFEGQTNYLKRKGLYPTIGGAIFKVRVSDNGMIQRLEYTFIPFVEIMDDWKNFPIPPETQPIEEPDKIETLFQLR